MRHHVTHGLLDDCDRLGGHDCQPGAAMPGGQDRELVGRRTLGENPQPRTGRDHPEGVGRLRHAPPQLLHIRLADRPQGQKVRQCGIGQLVRVQVCRQVGGCHLARPFDVDADRASAHRTHDPSTGVGDVEVHSQGRQLRALRLAMRAACECQGDAGADGAANTPGDERPCNETQHSVGNEVIAGGSLGALGRHHGYQRSGVPLRDIGDVHHHHSPRHDDPRPADRRGGQPPFLRARMMRTAKANPTIPLTTR